MFKDFTNSVFLCFRTCYMLLFLPIRSFLYKSIYWCVTAAYKLVIRLYI